MSPVTIPYIPSTLSYISTTYQMATIIRNTETSQYLPHTIYHKNAAQQARRNPADPHSHILQPKTSNIYTNAAQQVRRNPADQRSRPENYPYPNIYAQATSTTFSIHAYMHFQQHLLYHPDYHGLNIYYPAPRITGYQSPVPFVCASWTAV